MDPEEANRQLVEALMQMNAQQAKTGLGGYDPVNDPNFKNEQQQSTVPLGFDQGIDQTHNMPGTQDQMPMLTPPSHQQPQMPMFRPRFR